MENQCASDVLGGDIQINQSTYIMHMLIARC